MTHSMFERLPFEIQLSCKKGSSYNQFGAKGSWVKVDVGQTIGTTCTTCKHACTRSALGYFKYKLNDLSLFTPGQLLVWADFSLTSTPFVKMMYTGV